MVKVILLAAVLCSCSVTIQAQVVPVDPCTIPKYLTRTRPHPDGRPVEVEIGIFLIDVIEVNEVEESFTVDFDLSLAWRDPRLSTAERGASLEDCRLTLAEIWHPQVDLINRRGVALAQNIDVDISADGTVRFSQRLSGSLSSPLDMRRFPFDIQKLRIKLASFEYGPEDVRFVVSEGRTALKGIAVPGWNILDISSDANLAPRQSNVGEHTSLDHVITVERRSRYYFWKFVVPLVLIVAMAWSALWFNPKDYRPAIGISTASVFSLIAFLLGLRQMTPRIPYLTRMDELILSSTLLVFLVLGQSVIKSRLVHRERFKLAQRVDRVARGIYFMVVLVVLARFFFG